MNFAASAGVFSCTMPRHSSIPLVCHPTSACPAVASILVQAGLTARGLSFAYSLGGELSNLSIPATLPPGQADRLWEHTCFEAFVGVVGSRAYREFNFSPSGQWAVYDFSGYRDRDESIVPAANIPNITVRRSPDRLELDVALAPALLPDALAGATFQLGLSAVIEATDGSRSYWALAHPAAQPDFHHRGAFALMLPVPAFKR